MFKYIVILAIAFGGYKAFLSPEGFMKSSSSEVYSDEYKFQVQFPNKPKEKSQTVDLPEFGKIKLTTYYVRSPELACSVGVSDYLEQTEVSGDIYDQIDVAKRHLLKGFGGSINKEEFIYNGSVSGYEFNMRTKSNKLLQSRIFTYENNAYNLICQYQDTDDYRIKVNDFMQSFTFI